MFCVSIDLKQIGKKYTLRAVCHSGLDPESRFLLDSCFRRNDGVCSDKFR
jgi:hypothetical protein